MLEHEEENPKNKKNKNKKNKKNKNKNNKNNKNNNFVTLRTACEASRSKIEIAMVSIYRESHLATSFKGSNNQHSTYP